MPKFRKKPIIVEAEQFFYGKLPINGVFYPRILPDGSTYQGDAWVVTIHDQRVYLSDGDWILPEPDGIHFYPVKDDIFQATYEYARDLRRGVRFFLEYNQGGTSSHAESRCNFVPQPRIDSSVIVSYSV